MSACRPVDLPTRWASMVVRRAGQSSAGQGGSEGHRRLIAIRDAVRRFDTSTGLRGDARLLRAVHGLTRIHAYGLTPVLLSSGVPTGIKFLVSDPR